MEYLDENLATVWDSWHPNGVDDSIAYQQSIREFECKMQNEQGDKVVVKPWILIGKSTKIERGKPWRMSCKTFINILFFECDPINIQMQPGQSVAEAIASVNPTGSLVMQ